MRKRQVYRTGERDTLSNHPCEKYLLNVVLLQYATVPVQNVTLYRCVILVQSCRVKIGGGGGGGLDPL